MCEAKQCCGVLADKPKLLAEFKQLEDNLKDAEADLDAAYLKVHALECFAVLVGRTKEDLPGEINEALVKLYESGVLDEV